MPTRTMSEKCPTCGSTGFTPDCPECKEMEEVLLHVERGIEGYDK